MKLLITTQAIDLDDPVLGFFHRWLIEFSKQCESIHVICLKEGRHELPKNVFVHSLGKEKGTGRIIQVVRFYHYIREFRSEYDAVFVHMNPEYVVLGGPLWRLWGKPIALWYVHKSVTAWLRVAVHFATVICTVSRESFPVPTSKLLTTGHGIDTDLFQPRAKTQGVVLRIITVGRFSASKGIREIFFVLDELDRMSIPFAFTMIGAPVTSEDRAYEREVRSELEGRAYKDSVRFSGPVPHEKLPALFAEADVFLNLSSTGGADKAVLEALSSGVPAVTSNTAFREMLAGFGFFVNSDPRAIAEKILSVRDTDPMPLHAYVEANHSLHALIPKILAAYQGLV